MAFDEILAARIREILARKRGIEEKKMFGCVCFMLKGNALVGVWKDSLIARLGPDNYDDALLEPHVREFDITGKPMKGWVLVEPGGVEEDDQLKGWIEQVLKFVKTLPAKER
ncbi:MAG: TfoX/Sxy family protein [Gemmataceae bacterium]